MVAWPWTTSKAVTAPVLRRAGKLPDALELSKPFKVEYRLDSSKIDVPLARALYYNTDPRYKLGAGFARPAINVPVGFMGIPKFAAEAGGDAQKELDRVMPTWSGGILRAHVSMLRDGECLLRIQPANRSPAYAALYEGEDWIEVDHNMAGTYDIETLDEDIGAVKGIRVEHKVLVKTGAPTAPKIEEKSVFETVYADRIIIEWENDFRAKKELANTLGFVPAIHLQNSPEVDQLHASSELEPVEPYLRFYNDVMLHAGAASSLHSTAKLIIRVKQLETFLANNFNDADLAEGRLRFKDKDVLFFESGIPDIGMGASGGSAFAEGAEVVQATAPLGDTNTLLEYIFLNIVDVTEVPEWAFGGAIASSKASVSEQSPPLIHKVNRKRTLTENSWALAGRMGLAMLDQRSAVTVTWDDLQQRDTKAEAEALKALADSLISLNDAEMISKYAAVEQLRPFMPALLEYIVADRDPEDEQTRIDEERSDEDANQQALLEKVLGGPPGVVDEQDRQAGLSAVG